MDPSPILSVFRIIDTTLNNSGLKGVTCIKGFNKYVIWRRPYLHRRVSPAVLESEVCWRWRYAVCGRRQTLVSNAQLQENHVKYSLCNLVCVLWTSVKKCLLHLYNFNVLSKLLSYQKLECENIHLRSLNRQGYKIQLTNYWQLISEAHLKRFNYSLYKISLLKPMIFVSLLAVFSPTLQVILLFEQNWN